MDSASSSFPHPGQGQSAGAHSGLAHPVNGQGSTASSAPSGKDTVQDAVPVLRVVCGWCPAVIREGVEPVSHGICPTCSDRETARLREARAHLLPLYVTRQEPAGTYRIEDRDGRMLARNLPGSGIAAAMAVRLEDLKKSGEGWCPKHVPAPLREGRCVSCALHLESSQWAVNR